MQTMNARHVGVNSEYLRQRPRHEKNRVDGAAAAAGGWLETLFMITMVREPRIWFVIWRLNILVQTLKDTHDIIERGDSIYATTRYIWMYIPQDGIDDDVVAVGEGYSGSSKDYYYR